MMDGQQSPYSKRRNQKSIVSCEECLLKIDLQKCNVQLGTTSKNRTQDRPQVKLHTKSTFSKDMTPYRVTFIKQKRDLAYEKTEVVRPSILKINSTNASWLL